MIKQTLILIVGCILFGCEAPGDRKPDAASAKEVLTETTCILPAIYHLHYDAIDQAEAEQIEEYLKLGQKNILEFFNQELKNNFDVYIFSARDSLDAQWQKDWNMPGFKSECWMVACGIAHRLDILSPRVWDNQACEHNINDSIATQNLIIHELIHVFHAQNNPSPTFEHIENLDWLVEGIAVYASGQLDQDRYERAKASVLQGEGPARLADVWKGEHRYGFSGSIVKFINDKYGRDTFVPLMGMTTATEVLLELNISEEELIRQWKASF